MSRTTAAVRTLAAAMGMALASSPALAQEVVIDFREFRAPYTTEYQATPGGDVHSKGFEFAAAFADVSRNALGTWGTAPDESPDLRANLPRNLGPTAAALWGTTFSERIDMFREDDFLFNLLSIDLAHQFAQSYLVSGSLAPFTVTFFGFNSAGVNTAALQQTFTIPVPSAVGNDVTPQLNTYTFNNNFRNLSQVAWFQSGTGSATAHQFTNVRVAIVTPEPSTYVLFGTGLAGIMLVSVRRRRA